MKKHFLKAINLYIFLISLFLFILPQINVINAQSQVGLCPTNVPGLCQAPALGDFISNVINIITIAGILIALIFLIIGGIKWITSGGDKAKVESARGAVIGAIIGLIVILGAYFIISVVFTIVTGNTPGGIFSLPSLL